MTIVLDEPWEFALFFAFCGLAMFYIARDLWRSVRPERPASPDKIGSAKE